MTAEEFYSLVKSEIDSISAAAQTLNSPIIPELRFLQDLVSHSFTVTPEKHASFNPQNANTFYFDTAKRQMHISTGFAEKWLSMRTALALTDEQLRSGVAAFLLHEFMHVSQGLTSPRHSDAREAVTATYFIDYFADMSAAIAAFYLSQFQQGTWQPRLAAAIEGVWLAMAVFEFPISAAEPTLLRFKRYFLAHYQYHRVRHHRGKDPVKIQMLFLPAVDFFSLRSKAKITPAALLDAYDRSPETFMWLVAPDDASIPTLVRLRPPRNRVEALAHGIFEAQIADSYSYFEYLFSQAQFLLGGIRGDNPDQPLTRHLAT